MHEDMEIRFIAHMIDQLDFALDHIVLQDPNYKRLSLMLIDNALELALHEHAEEKKQRHKYDRELPDPFRSAMEAALGRHFESKVKFAKITGFLTEEMGQTIVTLHSYRNQLYHRGLMHEEILHSLAMFYFGIACDVMAALPHFGYSWGNRTKIPFRAIKYLGTLPFKDIERTISQAWTRLKDVASAIPYNLTNDLHNQLAAVVGETDELLDYLSRGHPQKMTRDELVMDVQAWSVMFTEKGKEFARSRSTTANTIQGYADWFRDNYPFDIKRDPIKSWNEQSASLKAEKNEHTSLKKYHEFIQRTEGFRRALSESVAAFDAEVDRQIDAARESRDLRST
jgi:hypothetical protein